MWERNISDIAKISLQYTNNASHENMITVAKTNGEEVLLSHNGRVIKLVDYKLLDERYQDFVQSGILGSNHYEPEQGIDVKCSCELENGYHKIELKISGNVDGYKLFDENGHCIYIGNDETVMINKVCYSNKLVMICSKDVINVGVVRVMADDERPVYHFIGDSTLANQRKKPLYGWAQLFQAESGHYCNNIAFSGRSVKSFCFEGRFNRLLNEVKQGDVVAIGFGHNEVYNNFFGSNIDEYIDYLQYYKRKLESIDCKVFICTPIPICEITDHGSIMESHETYRGAIYSNFETSDIIDIYNLFMDCLKKCDTDPMEVYYNNVSQLEMYDNIHLNINGAKTIANLYVNAVKKQMN